MRTGTGEENRRRNRSGSRRPPGGKHAAAKGYVPLLTILTAVSILCSGLTAGVPGSYAAESASPRMAEKDCPPAHRAGAGKRQEGLAGKLQGDPANGPEEDPAGRPWEDLPGECREALSGSPELPEFTQVERDYFDDALFIGDSRVVGVQLYAGWDNMTYYAEKGMTVYNMFDRKVTGEDGEKISVRDALQQRSFGKIYLEIGINEMGTGTVDSFMEAYEEAVACLRGYQPDALIFLCGIMCIRQDRSESDPVFNNRGIRERNRRIAQLADGSSIFYLDINEEVADEAGDLNPEYTWDAVHLLGKYDALWLEYFCRHGIVKE